MVAQGWTCVAEPGRRVIAQAQATGTQALPWQNMEAFLRACMDLAQGDLRQRTRGTRTIHDRGGLDAALGLARLGRGPEPDVACLALFARPILLAPPWPDLFEHDADRRHGLDAALAEYDHIQSWLHRHAVPYLNVPRLPVIDRVAWMTRQVWTDAAG
ncbi:ATPase [Jannaschia pagri]|uniref:ATPase n=2 Tax=Roseobacteraceae TaxID=2854170 RepID=A0ABQ4NJ62_9RHOB|nr:ATPase [Jannaschia sp. AI_61]GIT94446.1 ATPase [Jannaschia sp. AI_62]